MTRRALLFIGAAVVVSVLGGGLGLWLSRARSLPAVTLTSTPTTPTMTDVPTDSPTVTATLTITPTATLTPSATATTTATLSTLVVAVTAINPDVTRAGNANAVVINTATLRPTLLIPTPGVTLPFISVTETTPSTGWFRYGVDHPTVQQVGAWQLYSSTYRSVARHYLYSDANGARLSLRFEGAAARVRYARFYAYGVFEVRVDGQTVTTVDSYLPKTSPNGDFVTTDVFGLANGWHTLDIVRLDRRNPDSSGGYIAIDGIDVYQAGIASTDVPPAQVTPTSTPSPAPVQRIQALIAPPTVQSTPTPAAPALISVSLTIAYDANGNKIADPSEGVRGLTVQLVAADTNRIVASGLTDAQGYVRLQTAGSAPLRLIVPYFNRFWDVPPRASGTQITLLIPPANRPALIP